MGLKLNVRKTKSLPSMPTIRQVTLRHGAHHSKLQKEGATYEQRSQAMVDCETCGKSVQARCLTRHIASQHPEVPQPKRRRIYNPSPQKGDPRNFHISMPQTKDNDTPCPVPLCKCIASSKPAMRNHFMHRHTKDCLRIKEAPMYQTCDRCQKYINTNLDPARHQATVACAAGNKRRMAKIAEQEVAQPMPTFDI